MNPSNLNELQTEDQIPFLAAMAVEQAHAQVRAAGIPVLVSENGELTEICSDGTRRILRRLEPGTVVKSGQVITLQ